MAKKLDVALLILRVGIGIVFIVHGLPKLNGGPELWTLLGGSMKHLGINFLPAFWGFMAMVAELFGGICLILGIYPRLAAILMLFTMLVAGISELAEGQKFKDMLELFQLTISLIVILLVGGGKYVLVKSKRWG